MQSLCYIVIKSVKNRLLEMLHNPGRLILYILCIGLIALPLLNQPISSTATSSAHFDIIWLQGCYFFIAIIFLLMSVYKGLSNGDVVFDMQDVNLLFASPISPKSILIYGLTKMAGTAFLAVFFMLFMSRSIYQTFGQGFDSVLILFFSLIFLLFVLSLLSLVIYTVSHGSPRRKLIVKILIAVLFVPIICVFVMQLIQSGQPLVALEQTLRSPVLTWTPLFGWSTGAALSFINGATTTGFIFLGAMLIAGALFLAYILFGKADYYEDVLVATETSFERKMAIASGQVSNEPTAVGKTKVSKTGVTGTGASAFFYKHMRETKRASVLGSFSWTSISFIIGTSVLALMLKKDSSHPCFFVLCMYMWAQIFMIGMGRGIKETTTHYIYLVPESPLKKIFWSNLEPVAQVLLESTLMFVIAGILVGESPFIIAGCIAVYTLFALMLISINYLSMRFSATNISSGLLIALYILAILLLTAPGVIIAAIASASIPGIEGMTLGLGIFSVWELMVSIGCFTLSKNIFNKCDIQSLIIKQK